MQRVLSTVTLLGLLAATAAAFAITEHLKLIKSPVYGTLVSTLISPVCRCEQSTASIRVRLRHPDRVTVRILDSGRNTVETLATDAPEPRSRPVVFHWNGRLAGGAVAPDGVYHPEIHLAAARRTILFPNRIVVDTRPPEVLSASVGKPVFSPGDHRTVEIRYAFSERAHAVLFLDGKQILRGRPTRARGVVKWAGTVDGRTVAAGRHVLSVGAVDLAGNATPRGARRPVVVGISFVAVSPHLVDLRPGVRFTVHVQTAAASYAWRFAGRHGKAHAPLLHLRAPARRGAFRLVVSEHGHEAAAVVRVRGR